jgi:signal transduction histidine kinase
MKLLNYTSIYFSIILIIIIPIWAGLFYYAMLDEVYDSIDDGLDNQRLLIVSEARKDSTILKKANFEEGNYSITAITAVQANDHRDIFIDTLMYMQNEKDYEPVRMLKTVFNNGNSYYSMRVITSMVEEDDLITELTRALLLLYFGLILTIVVLNSYLLRNIWKPFYFLMNQLRSFKLKDGQPLTLSKTRIDEFNFMQKTIHRFLTKNIESYNKQKQFIENASHELQTPLAIAMNKLELLADKTLINEEQGELLGSALNNLERLKRLNQSLLLLSKIENDQFDEISEVNVNDLVRKLLDDFKEQINFHQLDLSLKEETVCVWLINPDLADIMLSNLIKNAVRHSNRGKTIRIIISSKQLSIENDGGTALDEQIIFQRFYKSSTSTESTGLGLAIAKAVADVSQLKLEYHYPGKHVFTITPIMKRFPNSFQN